MVISRRQHESPLPTNDPALTHHFILPKHPYSPLNTMQAHELTVSMTADHLIALNQALYGPEYGFGERTLNLEMRSRSPRFYFKVPVICRYKENRPTLFAEKVIDVTWGTLCRLAVEEDFLKVEFCNGADTYDGRLSLPGKVTLEDSRSEMSLRWQEYDETKIVLKKGISWMKGKLI